MMRFYERMEELQSIRRYADLDVHQLSLPQTNGFSQSRSIVHPHLHPSHSLNMVYGGCQVHMTSDAK